jgi:hypothetical protein
LGVFGCDLAPVSAWDEQHGDRGDDRADRADEEGDLEAGVPGQTVAEDVRGDDRARDLSPEGEPMLRSTVSSTATIRWAGRRGEHDDDGRQDERDRRLRRVKRRMSQCRGLASDDVAGAPMRASTRVLVLSH